MSTAQHTRFASPATLLREWAERGDGAALHEVLVLGFTVDLPFLEKVAIPVARGLGARTAVIGDAAQGLYDSVDVRMAGRGYLHGLAACRGAFHPKVVLLLGEHACRLAVGSGNPTLSGWGANDELWTFVETEEGASHALLADLADWLGELPDAVSLTPWCAEHLREIAAVLTERHVNAPTSPGAEGRLLHNLRRGFLDQLPEGPVDELHLYAPFVDPTGQALRALADRLAPRHIVLGLQERWSSYDAETIRAALDGRSAQIRLLDESRMRHGKLVQWRVGDRWHSLTGSPNLTRAALCAGTADGGNCELAVLATDTPPLLPAEGRTTPPARFSGRTVRPVTSSGPSLVLLGARTDSQGLHVSLAREQRMPVTVSTSPDGSPGSWQDIGDIPAGVPAHTFPLAEAPGAAVRARCVRPDGEVATSPVVFAYSPVLCARRDSTGAAPRLRYDYTVEDLFADERAARRFENDLRRLRELTAGSAAPRVSSATVSMAGSEAVLSAKEQVNRWDAYLADCRRMIGDPLTGLAFGTPQNGLPQAPVPSRWVVSAISGTAAEDGDGAFDGAAVEEDGERTAAVRSPVPLVPPTQRPRRRTWIRRWIRSLASSEGQADPPVPVRLLVTGLCVQLLAAGVWDEDDHDWRTDLGSLVSVLVPDGEAAGEDQELPPETRRRLDAVLAVVMALLHQGASLTGGGEHDLLASRAWARCKEAVARADPGAAEDLMLPPERPLARVTSWSEVERIVGLARNDSPHAAALEEFAAAGWSVSLVAGIWEVAGSFGNPLPVAATVATRLGRDAGTVLVRAGNGARWTFVAWRSPHLVLLNPPARVWRTYRISPPATPASRFGGGDLSAVHGRIGPVTPLGAGPPPALRQLLDEVGLGYPELIGLLLSS